MATRATTAPSNQQTEPETVEAAAARERFDALVDRVFGEGVRVVVERGGKAVAAMVSPQDLARLQAWDRERADDRRILDEIGAKFADVPPEEIEREAVQAVQAVRARRRAERERSVAADE